MRIFLDCTHTAKHSYKNTGIHRSVRELVFALTNLCSDNSEIEIIPVMFEGYSIRRLINFHSNEYDEKQPQRYISSKTKKNYILLSKVKNKIFNYASTLQIKLSKVHWFDNKFEGTLFSKNDIYIIADANWDLPRSYYYFLQSLKKNKVVMGIICYDLIPMKFPEYCSKKFSSKFADFYNTYSLLLDKVICISENSKKDYIEAFGDNVYSKNKDLVVTNFRLGCNFKVKNTVDDTEYSFNNCRTLHDRYILVVGSLTPHKNIKNIIAAFDLLSDEDRENIHLVFAGNTGWDLATDRLVEDHKMYKDKIHVLGSVTDLQLDILYKRCYCLVQASFYEGFGLPVVEALQHGKPVISSTGGSLPEVGGDFCMYFNPNQPQELCNSLKKILNSDLEYDRTIQHIENNYKIFSWQESAREFLDCICQ